MKKAVQIKHCGCIYAINLKMLLLSLSVFFPPSRWLLKLSRSVFKKNKMQTQLGNLNRPPHGMHTYAGDCI